MFFENGAIIFGQQPDKNYDQLQKRLIQLEEKLKIKNEVLSELMEEHIALKKVFGGSERAMGRAAHMRPGC